MCIQNDILKILHVCKAVVIKGGNFVQCLWFQQNKNSHVNNSHIISNNDIYHGYNRLYNGMRIWIFAHISAYGKMTYTLAQNYWCHVL